MGKGNKQITEEKENRILELYREGLNCKQISETVKSTEPTVKNALLNFGIDYKVELEKAYKLKYEEALELYRNGAQLKKLCRELEIGPNTFKKYIIANGLEVKTQAESLSDNMDRSDTAVLKRSEQRQQYSLDETVFDDLSNPDAAYWLGFLYTDGSISGKDTSYMIKIGLSEKDDEHLKKFCRFLKTPESRVRYSKSNKACYVAISSVKIHKRLKELGFTKRKSWDAIPNEAVLHSRDFWRGCIDGDGSLIIDYAKEKYKIRMAICGTPDTCQCFKDFITPYIMSDNKLNKRTESFYTYVIASMKEVKEISKLLYYGASTFLDRKYEKYLEMQRIK